MRPETPQVGHASSPVRRPTRSATVGGVRLGGGAPVSVQSMTKCPMTDTAAVLRQIAAVQEAGADFVRLAVPDAAAAESFAEIRRSSPLPLVADVHFDHRLAIAAAEAGADKLRINPGNIGGREDVAAVAGAAKARGIPIRVGVNAGSLEQDLAELHGAATA